MEKAIRLAWRILGGLFFIIAGIELLCGKLILSISLSDIAIVLMIVGVLVVLLAILFRVRSGNAVVPFLFGVLVLASINSIFLAPALYLDKSIELDSEVKVIQLDLNVEIGRAHV